MIIIRSGRRTSITSWVRLLLVVPVMGLLGLVMLPVFGIGLLFWAAGGWIAWREIKWLQENTGMGATAAPAPYDARR